MKFCEKCGKEIMDEAVICTGCGCAVKKEVEVKKASYDDCVKDSGKTNIISIIVLAVGIVCALFVNIWVGAILCLVAEFVALAPNSKLQKLFKNNNLSLNKKEFKEKAKENSKALKNKYAAFKGSFIIAYISLACLVIFVLLGNALGL